MVLQFQYAWTTPNMLLSGRQQILSEGKEKQSTFLHTWLLEVKVQSTHLGPVISGAINKTICQPQSLETTESKPKRQQKSPGVSWHGR